MRTHGWGGDPPRSDDEAVARILEATRVCINRSGSSTSISDVATVLSITRQTVYRYFPTTEALFQAVAYAVTDEFMDGIAERITHIDDPGVAVVETIALALELLPQNAYLGLLFSSSRVGMFVKGVTSETGMTVGRSMFDRLALDWESLGLTGPHYDDFLEHVLRVMQSLLLDPGHPPKTGPDLRSYLTRWLWTPAILAAQGSNRPKNE